MLTTNCRMTRGGGDALTLIYNAPVTRATDGRLIDLPGLVGVTGPQSHMYSGKGKDYIFLANPYNGTTYVNRLLVLDTLTGQSRVLNTVLAPIPGYEEPFARIGSLSIIGNEAIVLGRRHDGGKVIGPQEAINFITDTKRTVSPVPTVPPFNVKVPPLYGNEIIFAGGTPLGTNEGRLADVRSLNPITGTQRTFVSLQQARNLPATGLIGSELIIAGGFDTSITANIRIATVEAINLVTNTRRSLANMAYGRDNHTSDPQFCTVNDDAFVITVGRIYVNVTDAARKSVEVYYPKTNTKALFYRNYPCDTARVHALNGREVIFEEKVLGVDGIFRAIEIMDVYTGEIKKVIDNPWGTIDPGDLSATQLFDSELFSIGGSISPRVQKYALESIEENTIKIPHPVMDLGVSSILLDVSTQLPVPVEYQDIQYAAGTMIPVYATATFKIPDTDTPDNIEVKYSIRKGDS